jgi:RNase P/RNase MRP subunit p30
LPRRTSTTIYYHHNKKFEEGIMFIECNVPINLDQIDENKLISTCVFLQKLGWDGVVFNMYIGAHNFANLDAYIQQFPLLMSKIRSALMDPNLSASENVSIHFSAPLHINNSYQVRQAQNNAFKLYSRLTFIENFKQFNRLNFDEKKYRAIDLLAIVPTTVGQLRNIVQKLNMDIICFYYDLAIAQNKNLEKEFLLELNQMSGGSDFSSLGKNQKEILHSGKRQIVQLMKREISLEICYAPAIKHEALFMRFMHLFMNIVRITKSRNIILCNGMHDKLLFRSPYDVANMALMIGLDYSIGKHLITTHVREALMHGEQRCTLKGIVNLVLDDEEKPIEAADPSKVNSRKRNFNKMKQSS